MQKPESDQISDHDRIEHALRVAEDAIKEVGFKDQLKHGALYAETWFGIAVVSPSESRAGVTQEAISELCKDAKSDFEAFETAKWLAGWKLLNNQSVPEELAALIGSFLTGEIKPPAKPRGPPPAKHVLRDFLIYRMASRLEEKTDLQSTQNGADADDEQRARSVSAVIRRTLKKLKPDPRAAIPSTRMIEKIIQNEKENERFVKIDAARIKSLFDFE